MVVNIWSIGKWLWSLLGWLRSLLRPPHGPAVTIAPVSIRHTDRQDVNPQCIVLENSGTATAFNLEYEIRKYYAGLLPPSYDKKRKRLSSALKPGDSFSLKLLEGSGESLSLADFYDFEIFVHYQNAAKQAVLFYVSVGMAGEVKYRDHAVNPFRRLVLPTEVWCKYFFASLWIHIKVKTRPKLYRVGKWIVKKAPVPRVKLGGPPIRLD